MILSDKTILQLLHSKQLEVTPLDIKDIQCNHIDLHLSPRLFRYTCTVIDLKNDLTVKAEEVLVTEQGFELKPGDFFIGSTVERVAVPNGYWGFIETKGNIARAGIQAHNTDGHIDPGFSGTITLEIKNNAQHSVVIYPGMAFVQIHFFQATTEALNPYKGKYQYQQGGTLYAKD